MSGIGQYGRSPSRLSSRRKINFMLRPDIYTSMDIVQSSWQLTLRCQNRVQNLKKLTELGKK